MRESDNFSPPKVPLRFLRWFCNPDLIEDVEGDISEIFSANYAENKSKAKMLFLLDVLLLLRPGIIKNFEITQGLINTAMLKNYLKIARRNAIKYKGFTALNLLGLVIGIASSMLILLWINDEVNIDKFHANGDRIYQVFRNMRQSEGAVNTTFTIPKPAADLMRQEYPEVLQVANYSWPISFRFRLEDQTSDEDGRYASAEFFNLFSFDFLSGDRETALDDLNSIVVSRRLAEKYFGKEWKGKVVGTTFRLDDNRDAIVTGVFETPGANSTLQFDWILPAQEFFGRNDWVNDWGNGSFGAFFTVKNDEDARKVADRIKGEIKVHAAGQDNVGDEELVIHKFQDYYLYSNFENGVVSGGRIDYVRILGVVAIFILLIACINFMNLATARSSRRSKEIGLRKVMGSRKKAITSQFFFESILLTTISVILSVFVVWLALPFFNDLVEKSLTINFLELKTWIFFIGIILIVGVLSGSYPALILPKVDIINSLKGTAKLNSSTALRKGLVVFQFAISTLLIIGTAVIYNQLQFVLNKDLGLEKENMVLVPLEGDLRNRLETYKSELKKIPEVKAVTASSGNPIDYGRSTSSASWEGKSPEQGYEINILLTDFGFVETMGMEMKSGRAFSEEYADSTNFIINEVAAELMGFEDPIEKDLSFWGINGKIIGVVKNFHMSDMYEPIAPLIISCLSADDLPLALIRVQGNTSDALLAIEETTSKLNPSAAFDYEFLDSSYEESYNNEKTVSSLAGIFSIISIFVSCLGLFGLSAFTAERRSKEIGIRKVHGASTSQIIFMLSKDYSKLMIIAFVLAIPFAYYYMQQWLNDFEFRMDLGFGVFIAGGIATFLIGGLTVWYKSYQAAIVNPSVTLKDE